MNIVLSILQRTLVSHFYKVNAGLFFFLFFVFFGLPSQPLYFHISLITGIVQSQVFLGLLFCLWLLYNLKCLDYITTQMNEPRQLFLASLNNLSYKRRLGYMCYVQLMVYMPVLLYSVAIIVMSFSKSLVLPAVEVVVFNVLVVVVPSHFYVSVLDKKALLPVLKFPVLSPGLRKPLFVIPLLHLWYNRKQMLLVTKTLSLLALLAFLNLYEPEEYDIRPLLLCMLLCASAHTAIIFEVKAFEEEYLSFVKNFAVPLFKRFGHVLVSFAILLLPELLFVWKGYGTHFSFTDFPQVVILSIGILCLYHAILLIEETNMDQFVRIVFWIMSGCFFILLYNPGLLFAFAILLLSYVLYASYYYHYEKKI